MASSEDPGQLAAVEARIRALLEPYRSRMEEGTIYGVPVLRRAGAKAHDWFAGVQMADGYVKLNFLPMHGHPGLLEGLSAGLRKHKTGASVFRFTEVDEALLAEVDALLGRGFDVYMRGR